MFSQSGPGNQHTKFSMLTSNATNNSHVQAIHASPTPSGLRSGTPASMEDAAMAASMCISNPSVAASTLQLGTTNSLTITAAPSDAAAPTSSELSKDAQDFFTRAQAMGLRLTREDYERTKASVAAFLKAEQKPFLPTTSASTISASTTSSKVNEAKATAAGQGASSSGKTEAAEAAKPNESKIGLGKPVSFSAKRGLLFSAPGSTTLNPPPASLAEAVHLDGGIGKGFMLSTALPLCIGQSLRAGTAGDKMIHGKLPFTSPRSTLVCAQSSTALDLRHNCQPSSNICNFLGSAPSRSKHRQAGLRKIDTISPANVFGSSLPHTVSAPNIETKLG
ncbi:hypothetical protein NDA13_002123 [Ustilago tritici]|nr:hypothetical protein NDA13_002123 [Ustilago tritici]